MQAAKESPRSDSDVLLQEIKLTFGDKEYTVPVLRSRKAAKWRQQYFEMTAEVTDALPEKFEQDNNPREIAKAVRRGMLGALIEFPDKIPDLVFSYAPSLKEKEEEILDAAYDQQWRTAFDKIWEVAFAPFLGCLGMMTEMNRSLDQQRASRSRLSASTN